jgi:hypothetical protein
MRNFWLKKEFVQFNQKDSFYLQTVLIVTSVCKEWNILLKHMFFWLIDWLYVITNLSKMSTFKICNKNSAIICFDECFQNNEKNSFISFSVNVSLRLSTWHFFCFVFNQSLNWSGNHVATWALDDLHNQSEVSSSSTSTNQVTQTKNFWKESKSFMNETVLYTSREKGTILI